MTAADLALPPPARLDALILANTMLASPPVVPEVRLHLASDVTGLWHATERDLDRQGLPPPFWAFAWPGGQALARLMLDQPDLVRDRVVLDLGSGSGLGSITAVLAGARLAHAVDIDPVAARACLLNARVNGVEDRVRPAAGDPLDKPAPAGQVIIAGDVCYERPAATRIIGWLRAASRAGSLVLLADPGRTYAPTEGLEPLWTGDVPTSRDLEDRDQRATTVWRVLPEAVADTLRAPAGRAGP